MSGEVEPLGPGGEQHANVPAPAAQPAPPVMAPPVTGALFGTGLGAGMDGTAGMSFVRHLARRPAEERKALVADLNERAGNRTVTRMLRAATPLLSRREDTDLSPPPDTPATVDFEKLISERDISGIKSTRAYGKASPTQRIRMIEILLDQDWVGPADEYALEALWDTFGSGGIVSAYESNTDLFKKSVVRGAELYDIPAVQGMRDKFASDVKAVAGAYMRRNRTTVEKEAERLGLGGLKGPAAPAAQLNKKAIAEVQQMAAEVVRADDALGRLLRLPVGYDYEGVDLPGGTHKTTKVLATYNPAAPPMVAPRPEEAAQFAKYEDVDKQYKAVTRARAVLAARSPGVFAASEQDAGRGAGKLAKATPEQAAAQLRELLGGTLKNIEATEPKIGTGDLDWRDLIPIHKQLYDGLPSESGVKWSSGLTQAVAKDVIGDYEAKEFWVTLGLGSLAAAAFIFSNIATAGMASFLWAAAGAAISAGQAAMSWERYEDLATAAGSAASGETRLVEGEQVTEALLAAVMDTAFAFLDGFSAVKGAGAAIRAVQARKALEQLAKLARAEAKEVVERAVRELGAEETIRRSGKTAEELAELAGHESDAAAKLREAAEKITVEPPQAAGGGSTSVAPTEAGRRIAAKSQGVFGRWAKLSPTQRLHELVAGVNEELAKLGCPPLDPVVLFKGGTTRGRLNFAQWELAVNEDLLKSANISEAAFADLVGTITHEARHGEQWFRMAQLEAMTSGANAAAIAKKLRIPHEVAEAAIEVQNGFRKGIPLVAGSAAEAEAKAWYKSVYGADKAARAKAYKDLRAAGKKVAEATEELASVKKTRPKGHPDIAAAEARWKQAKAERVKARQPYLALPEEVDARAAGDAAAAGMRERLELLNRIKAARAAEREAFGRYEPLESLWESVLGRENLHLSYDKLLEFHGATDGWQKAIYAVSELEEQLERLATAGVKP
jgi:hypothetical protein